MSRLTPVNQLGGTETNHSTLQRVWNIVQALNGGLDFGTSTQTTPSQYTGNMNGQWVNIAAPATPNTEFALPHSLGRIPSFYFWNSDVACALYQLPNTGTPWTSTNIYLKCSVASANLRVFIQ